MAANSRHRFLLPEWSGADTVELPESEAKHAKVVRIRSDEEIEIFDGRGRSAIALLHGTTAEVRTPLPDHHREAERRVTLAVAALKKDRFEYLIEKATEIGVAEFVVYTAERSIARPSARQRERWSQTAEAAAKQCGRTVVPSFREAADLQSIVQASSTPVVVLHEHGEHPSLASVDRAEGMIVAIGPEGGFANGEIMVAENAGATIASLGERILRAETAAVAAATITLSS